MIHQPINFTPFIVDLGFCQDVEGGEIAVALIKATYLFDEAGRVERAEGERRLPVLRADVFHDAPEDSSLRHAAEIVPARRGTDVAVEGHVYGRGSRSVVAGVRVGSLQKALVASGARVWASSSSGDVEGPRPFERIPLRYEEAYGGSYDDGRGGRVAYEPNPVGKGFTDRLRPGAPLPALEYADHPLRSAKDRPAPACLGFIPTFWRQRARFAGTFDEEWSETRRPLMPADFDERFYNAVPEDQVVPGRLRGGETVTLRNLHPRAETVRFELPALRLSATFRIKERVEPVAAVADTLLLRPDDDSFSLTYRASCAIGDDLRFVRSVTFEGDGWGHA